MTSSDTSRTPYRSQISRTIGQYSSPGTALPALLATGSAMNAAIVSGLCARMSSSTCWAQYTAQSDAVVAPDSHR